MDLFEGRAAGDLDALVAKNLNEQPGHDGIVFAKKNSWLRAHGNEVLGGSARIHGELRISTNVLPSVRGRGLRDYKQVAFNVAAAGALGRREHAASVSAADADRRAVAFGAHQQVALLHAARG